MEELNKWLVAVLVLAIIVIGVLFWKLIKAIEAQVATEYDLATYRDTVRGLNQQLNEAIEKIDAIDAKPAPKPRPAPSNSKLATAQRKAAAPKTTTKSKAPTQRKAAAKAKR